MISLDMVSLNSNGFLSINTSLGQKKFKILSRKQTQFQSVQSRFLQRDDDIKNCTFTLTSNFYIAPPQTKPNPHDQKHHLL